MRLQEKLIMSKNIKIGWKLGSSNLDEVAFIDYRDNGTFSKLHLELEQQKFKAAPWNYIKHLRTAALYSFLLLSIIGDTPSCCVKSYSWVYIHIRILVSMDINIKIVTKCSEMWGENWENAFEWKNQLKKLFKKLNLFILEADISFVPVPSCKTLSGIHAHQVSWHFMQ